MVSDGNIYFAKKLFNKNSINKFDLIIDLQSKIRNTLILKEIPNRYFTHPLLTILLQGKMIM